MCIYIYIYISTLIRDRVRPVHVQRVAVALGVDPPILLGL